ncbi:unnamed protein product [Orchesella dallaii]|uniref:Uncharacterized protein n=1 Tax=Orchesella dallaii TaxID=48710 RepID=A0ABP1Q992_9HEXA
MGSVNLTELFSKALPLIDQNAVWMYTIKDLFKPGPDNALQSALPMYNVILIGFAFIVWFVVFLYFWKLVFYLTDDPYATPNGSAPPNRSFDYNLQDKILHYIEMAASKFL